MIEGQKALARRIRRVQPEVVVFVGVSIHQVFWGREGHGAKAEEISAHECLCCRIRAG